MTYDDREKSVSDAAPVECYRFSYAGNVYRYTSGDQAITIEEGGSAGTYYPGAIKRDGLSFVGEDPGSSLAVTMAQDSDVAILFIPYTPTEPVAVTIFRTHYGDSEVITAFAGVVASVEFEDGLAKIICSPTSALLRRKVPRTAYQATCNWPLYGPRCGVNANSFKEDAIVAEISGAQIRATDFGAHPDGWFTNGWVQNDAGDRRFIVDHVGEWLTLMSPFLGLAVTDNVTAYAGCDRTEATCKAKFSNIINHFGFPRIPQRNVHDKGLG